MKKLYLFQFFCDGKSMGNEEQYFFDDDAAFDYAQEISPEFAIEIWQDGRYVGSVKHDDKL